MFINAENRPKMPLGKRIRRGAGALMLFLTLAGCGEAGASGPGPASSTETPYPQSTPTAQVMPTATLEPTASVQPTEVPTATSTPAVQDIQFTPGKWECRDVPAYSVAQGDFYFDGVRRFDNDAKSGSVGKILKAGTACTSYGGDIIVASPSTIDSITGQAVDEMSQKGCANNAGCPDGITVWVAGKN